MERLSQKHARKWSETRCEISTVDLSYVITVKSTVEILQNFVAFSEYMNFIGKADEHRIL